MRLASAPARLPFAPRPIPTELFSSWLLRVAAANHISLAELLDAFDARYPGVLPDSQSLDLGLPCSLLQALSLFCRVPTKMLRALDLGQRLSHLERVLLLRFPDTPSGCPRRCGQRLKYAFCPYCIAEQRIVHVPWDWCFACLIRCCIHRTSLFDSCPTCGESDPLSFAAPDVVRSPACWSCGSALANTATAPPVSHHQQGLQAVQEAYRAALLGVAPDSTLLGKATDRAFRKFIDDMLTTLFRNLDPPSAGRNTIGNHAPHTSRQDLLPLITDLILNAAPRSNTRHSRSRYLQGVKLWAIFLDTITATEGAAIQIASLTWPVGLQRRLASALLHQRRKRWPHGPFRRSPLRPGFKCLEAATVWELSAGNQRSTSKSGI
jgi:hypothetical protein